MDGHGGKKNTPPLDGWMDGHRESNIPLVGDNNKTCNSSDSALPVT